jgi:plastocyanin
MRCRTILMLTASLSLWLMALGASSWPSAADPPRDQTPADASVSIKDLKFSPATVTIKSGQTVMWTNNDDRDHNVTADDGSFKSGNLGAGKSFRNTFSQKGTFPYRCTYHPRMRGSIVVQ